MILDHETIKLVKGKFHIFTYTCERNTKTTCHILARKVEDVEHIINEHWNKNSMGYYYDNLVQVTKTSIFAREIYDISGFLGKLGHMPQLITYGNIEVIQ